MRNLAICALILTGALAWSVPVAAQGSAPQTTGSHRGAGLGTGEHVDESAPDPSQPPGQVVARVLNGKEGPAVGIAVDLVVTHDSVAGGKTERILHGVVDAGGLVTFGGLPTGSGYSFRVTVQQPPARYTSELFGLGSEHGHRVTLHVLPATESIEQTMVVGKAVLYLEPLDDVFQVTILFELFNGGETTWVPEDVGFRLPDGWKAFNPENAQGGLELRESSEGVRLAGSVGPGRHGVIFGFQVPRRDSESASIDVGLPPRVASARVMMESSPRMRLTVAGFPEAAPSVNRDGERILATQIESGTGNTPPLDRIDIRIGGLMTRGSGRWYALMLALGAIAWGIGGAVRSRKAGAAKGIDAGDASAARTLLLAELVSVEKARRAGEIGPETYGQARDVLVDALVRIDSAPTNSADPKPA